MIFGAQKLIYRKKMLKKVMEELLWLYIFLLPWQTAYIIQERFLNGFKWQEGSLIFYLTEVILWAVAVIFFIVSFSKLKDFNFKSRLGSLKSWRGLVFISSLIIILISYLSIIWSGDKTVTLYWAVRLSEALMFFYLVSISGLKKEKIFLALALSGFIQALLAISQFSSQLIEANKYLGLAYHNPAIPGAYVVQSEGIRWLRAYGSFAHPNILGGFMALASLVSWQLILSSAGAKKLKLWIILAFNLFGLGLSFSRSAFLGFIFGALVILIFSKFSKIEKVKTLIVSFIIAAVFFINFQPLILTRLNGADRLEIKSASERTASVKGSFVIIKNHWLSGVGIGNNVLAAYNLDSKKAGWDYQATHNIFLLIFSELGVLGLLAFLIFLIAVIGEAIIKKRAASLAFLVCLLITGLFDHYLWTGYVGLIIFSLSASLAVSEGD